MNKSFQMQVESVEDNPQWVQKIHIGTTVLKFKQMIASIFGMTLKQM